MSEPDTSPLPTGAALVVPARFNGPPGSGNGGWTSGALAWALAEAIDPDANVEGPERDAWPTIQVTLRRPPPLEVPLPLHAYRVEADVWGVSAHERPPGDSSAAEVVATAVLAADPMPVEPVGVEQIASAASVLAAGVQHPFGTCFACGTEREAGDGLALTPRRIDDSRVAITWTPRADVAGTELVEGVPRATLPVVWAALDCPGGWAEDLLARPMVLGRMTARVDALPVIGEEHVVVAELRGREGRKTFSAATLYDADGREVATAEHVWVAIDPAAFGWT